jgi:iron complex outermembrane recepter protein
MSRSNLQPPHGYAGRSRSSTHRATPWLVPIVMLLAQFPAHAQRADQNAVTAAEDAFGTSNGYQQIGLYSLNDARGFNPQQAGNLRLEGLYFDQPSPYVNQCLVRDTTMRIGIAAQSYSFPAPTGIADLKLYVPGTESRASAVLNTGSYDEFGALLEGQGKINEELSAAACVAYNRNFLGDLEALRSANISAAALIAWRPSADTMVLPFWSIMAGNDGQVIPSVYTDGFLPPPVYRPRDLFTDGFSTQGWHSETGGILLHHTFGATWSLAAGLFEALEDDAQTFFPQYLSVRPNLSAEDVLDVVPPVASSITSGEIRLTRKAVDGNHSRILEFSVRGRNANREYGGDAIVDYGSVTLGSPPPPQFIPFATTAVSRDETRQLGGGFSYEERWADAGSFALGLQKTDYRRTIIDPGSAPVTDSTAPVLGSARFTVAARPSLTIYGSFIQGLEDSLLAPTTATNRGQPPPATRTHQSDLGLRYAPDPALSLILGAFEIDKAYFNLDDAGLYTQLGTIRHRGIESSATYSAAGVTLVAGGVWLRPHVERTLAEPGATGTIPLGPVPLTLTLNLDIAPPAWKPLAAQMQLTRLSGAVATADDRSQLAPLTVLSVGMRYESTWSNHPMSIRLDVQNVTNTEGLRLTTVDQLIPQPARRITLIVAIDM